MKRRIVLDDVKLLKLVGTQAKIGKPPNGPTEVAAPAAK